MKLKQLSFTLLIYLAVISGKAAQGATLSVVADGLDNVRGLDFGPDGSLYVSGVGGDGRCVPGPSLEGLPSCVGVQLSSVVTD